MIIEDVKKLKKSVYGAKESKMNTCQSICVLYASKNKTFQWDVRLNVDNSASAVMHVWTTILLAN